MAIFGIVMASVGQITRHLTRFYNTHVAALEVQKQAIQAARWLSQELKEGSYQSVANLTTPASAVIFGSPRDLDGKLKFLDESMLWQKFVCYYADEIDGQLVLRRGELLFEKAAQAPPPVPDSIGLSSFESSAKDRIMARHIESIAVTVSDSAEIEVKANYGNGAYVLKLQSNVEMGN